jgi:hypothetical protein
MERAILAVIAVAILGVSVAMPARSIRAEPAATDCLTEPTGVPPQGSHWYYRTDRSTGTRCWHLKPQRDKGKGELAVSKPRPSSEPIAEPKVEPPAEPIARVAEPVAEVSALQSLWAAAAPIASEPPLSSEPGAAEQSEIQPPHEQGRQADEPSATSVLSVADPPAGAISNTRLATLALVAAALALAAVIALKVLKLFFVRWLQRRRSALRRQRVATSAASAPEPSDFAERSAHIAHIEENLSLLLRDLRRAA